MFHYETNLSLVNRYFIYIYSILIIKKKNSGKVIIIKTVSQLGKVTFFYKKSMFISRKKEHLLFILHLEPSVNYFYAICFLGLVYNIFKYI